MSVRRTSLQPRKISSAIAVALLAMMDQASAQTAPADPPAPPVSTVDRVVVTGSIIRRLADEEALPVTVIRAEELKARGHTELKDLMLELPQSASLGTNSGSAGPLLNLRGFGAPRTLVLLNGRRLSLEPFRDQYVPLTVIPQIALERAEVLRDGASSSYGSDAIAGVMNFITKKSFTGGYAMLQTIQPERSGGGETKRGGVIYGMGDLATDGWNVYVAFEAAKRSILYEKDRPEFIDGSQLNSLGIATAVTNGTTTVTPANILNAGLNRTTALNPYFSSGCMPGFSNPGVSGANQQCYFTVREQLGSFTQGYNNKNLYIKGTLKLKEDHQITAEINYADVLTEFDRGTLSRAQYKVLNNALNVPMTLPATSRWYPGGSGGVPAVVGVTGQTLNLNWGILDLGSQMRDDNQYNRRLVVTDEGRVGEWDYRTGLNIGTATRVPHFGKGFVSESGVAAGLANGKLNPFGLQDAEGRDYLNSISMAGTVARWVYTWNRSVDLTVSRELMQLSGGPVTAAAGAEFRRDQFRASGNDGAADILSETPFLATVQPNLPTVFPNGTQNSAFKPINSAAHRNITSVFAEIDLPILKNLNVNFSLRGDQYKDAGEGNYSARTINPKFAVRYEPYKGILLRGSINTGFRAPSLVELYQALTELKTDQRFDDPVLCPGGRLGTGLGYTGGTAVANLPAGVTAANVCALAPGFSNLPYATQLPKNSSLKEETSRNYTLGLVVEPISNLTVSTDYWDMYIKDVVSPPVLANTLADPVRYASLYVRNPNGTLAYVLNTNANLGGLKGKGIDTSINYAFTQSDIGKFRIGMDVVYLIRWASQVAQGGPWLEQVGQFNPGVDPNTGISSKPQVNFRTKYTASVAWSQGPWAAQLSQRWNGTLHDQNLPARVAPPAGTCTTCSGPRDIASYSQFNLTTSYTGFKNLKLTLGVNNLFDAKPPLTNHNQYDGYLNSIADVLGRAYNLMAEYKF